MTLENIDTTEALNHVRKLLDADKNISAGLKAAIEVLIFLVTTLVNRLNLNSRNSSKPPSSDFGTNASGQNTGDDGGQDNDNENKRKPGGQAGHQGSTLEPATDPNEIISIPIDRRTLPRDERYHDGGIDIRQVFSIRIQRFVTEYQAEVLIDGQGNRYVATFPDDVTNPTQYGPELKGHAVYLSQFQLLPYDRMASYFEELLQMPISSGSIYNFNLRAFEMLEHFELRAKQALSDGDLIHADETGIKLNGKKIWLHCASNEQWTFLYPHESRGRVAMDEMDVLPNFNGILCHDHLKTYFQFECKHSLCNAHHLRELDRAYEQEGQQWAKEIRALLLTMNKASKKAGGALSIKAAEPFIERYRDILAQGEQECPKNTVREKGKKGRIPQTKARNLLDRLLDYEDAVLRFLTDKGAPFTNNRGENDIRMSKVQQKISGCFRSMVGAKIFCRVRSFLITCRKQGVSPAKAIEDLFLGNLPDFMD